VRDIAWEKRLERKKLAQHFITFKKEEGRYERAGM